MLNENDFYKAFNEVIDENDKVVVIYSGISSFISNIKFKNKNIAKTLVDILEKIVTKKKTLIFPSFSANSFLKENKFDLKKSIDNIGILSKEALKRNYFRTNQPLHSYLIFGKGVYDIKNLKLLTSWGDSSVLDYMSKNNARICTFGLPWNKGCAYLHRFEELYEVPWRYFKTFKGTLYKNNKKIGTCSEKKYSVPLNSILKYDYKSFVDHIRKSKSYKKSSNNYFDLESVKSNSLDLIGEKIFSENPWIIVKNKKKIKEWIRYKKKKEIFLKIK